MPVNHYCDRYS